MGRRFYTLNRPLVGQYYIYSTTAEFVETGIGGASFLIMDAYFGIISASHCQILHNSNMDAAVKALNIAMYCARMEN